MKYSESELNGEKVSNSNFTLLPKTSFERDLMHFPQYNGKRWMALPGRCHSLKINSICVLQSLMILAARQVKTNRHPHSPFVLSLKRKHVSEDEVPIEAQGISYCQLGSRINQCLIEEESVVLVLLGVSGCGKTRAIFDLASKHYFIYFDIPGCYHLGKGKACYLHSRDLSFFRENSQAREQGYGFRHQDF